MPTERFEAFWDMVRDALAPGGKVFFVDSLRTPASTARDHRLGDPHATLSTRRLNDGREFRVVKIFYDPSTLARRLGSLGWDITTHRTSEFFLYAHGGRTPAQS